MREHQELTPSRMTFREFRDVVRLPTDLGVLTTRDKFVKSLLRRKRRRRVVLDIADDGVIIIRKYYGSTTTATRRRSPRRCVRAFAHSSSFFSFLCRSTTTANLSRDFFPMFSNPFFFHRWVPAFFCGGVLSIGVNTLCVCVCAWGVSLVKIY